MTRGTREGALPRLRLQPPERQGETQVLRALRALQRVLLAHPVAAQAAFSALAAEGRCFAETPEGSAWRARLEDSALLHHARLVWQIGSLSLLEEDPPEILPSAYLEGLLLAAASGDPDALLDRLFGADSRAADHAAPRR
jgi:hypothetical protein